MFNSVCSSEDMRYITQVQTRFSTKAHHYIPSYILYLNYSLAKLVALPGKCCLGWIGFCTNPQYAFFSCRKRCCLGWIGFCTNPQYAFFSSRKRWCFLYWSTRPLVGLASIATNTDLMLPDLSTYNMYTQNKIDQITRIRLKQSKLSSAHDRDNVSCIGLHVHW